MLSVKNLQKIIKAGVYLALLTSLVYIPQTIFGTIFGKVIYFQVIIELALPFFIYLVFVYKDFRPKINLFTKILLLFFISIFISSILGLDFSKSFWGYDERMRGLFTLSHFLLFYFYIITVFRTREDKKSLILFTVVIGMMVSLFGIVERLHPEIRIDKSIKVALDGHRIASTTGNSIFLAGYLIFVFFISWFYFAIYKNKTRFVALFTVVFSAIALFATGTRGAALGFLAGIFTILVLLFLISEKKQKIKISIFSLLLFILVFLAFSYNIGNLQNSKLNIFNRITNLSLEESSSQQRFLLWGVAWNAFLDKPILGWGLENFDYAFDRHYDVRFLRYNITQTWADRAHNIFLDFLVMGGVLGLGIFLLLFAYIFYVFLRRFLIKKNLSIIGMFVAFLVYAIFGLDSPSINLMLFFSFALVYLMLEDDILVQKENNKKDKYVLFLLLIILSLFSIYNFNIKPLYSGIYFINFLHTSDIDNKKILAEKLLDESSPYKDSLRQRFANEVFLEAGDTNYDKSYINWALDRAISEINKSFVNHKEEFSYPFTLGNLYLRVGDYKQASDYFYKALELSPNRQAVIFQLSTTALLEGDNDKAIKLLEDMVTSDLRSGQTHWRLAIAYLNNKQRDLAYKEISISIELGFIESITSEVDIAITLCLENNNYICLTELYMNLAEKSSGEEQADYYAKTATAYYMLGNKEEAIQYTNKAVQIEPSFKAEADLFLQQINN